LAHAVVFVKMGKGCITLL